MKTARYSILSIWVFLLCYCPILSCDSSARDLQDVFQGQQDLNLLSDETIYIRNNSNISLKVFVTNSEFNFRWQPAVIEGGQELLLKMKSFWLAVSVKNTEHDLSHQDRTNTSSKPSYKPNNLVDEGLIHDDFFIRPVRQGLRYEICFNTKIKEWKIRSLRGESCG